MIHLSRILFEPVLRRENFLSKQDARVKVIACTIVLVTNLIVYSDIFQVSWLIFYVVLALSWKVELRYIFGRLSIALLISIFLLITKLGNLHLALVILAGVSCVSLFSFSTPMEDIFSALSKLKISTTLLEVTFLMYKYIFIFFEELDSIYHAQVLRLGYLGFKNSFRSLSILVGMLMLRSFVRAQTCYEAILARGYKDKLSNLWT